MIITASNDGQAAGYRTQLDLQLWLCLLPEVDNAIVVADPGGKRVGSGGSTLFCLEAVPMPGYSRRFLTKCTGSLL